MTTAVRPTTLLLIEPVDTDAKRLETILHAAAPSSFAIARVSTPAEGVSHLEHTATDCALVDVDIAGSADLEIIERLAVGVPGVAFVALTARTDDEIGIPTVHAGAIDCLSKPALQANLLVASIRHAILRKRYEASLDEAESIAQVGSWEVDLATNRVSWSHELYRLLGFELDHTPSYDDLLGQIHPDDRAATVRAVHATIDEHIPFVLEHRLVLPDAPERWIRARGRVELDGEGRPGRLLGVAQDITRERAAAADLAHQELHDALTGLPNRRLLCDRLDQALVRLARVNALVAVILVDIDRFKVVNDDLGRSAGDQLLVATATRLKDLVRPEDTLARIEGDKFVVLCEGIADQAAAVAVADRICAAMREPLVWDGRDLVISVSAGIALAASTSATSDELLMDADAATRRAKAGGRAQSAVFADTMRVKAVGRLDIETSLRHSIDNGDLRVHYQPIVSLVDGQVLGHEALVRWAHPARGLLGPDEFIRIAEESGLIVPLGAWVVREACRQAKRFQARDPRWPRLMMSVNLSGVQLGRPDLVDLISSALRDADLEAGDLQLEMTESVLMDDAPSTVTVLETLHDLGVRLSIDDFGTGYSSLAYLRRFPVDVLKIDQTFVEGLGKDLEDSAIVAAVVNLADTLGFTTIAEGVETELQRECLVGLGCTRAQGYLFARPVAAPEAEAALDHAGTVALS